MKREATFLATALRQPALLEKPRDKEGLKNQEGRCP